jgi:hypothetical protein
MSQENQIKRAKKDLSDHLHIDEGRISVKSARATQWPNASLGMEEPGTGFAMVMIDGYVIELQVNGKTYTYHADEDRRVVRAS